MARMTEMQDLDTVATVEIPEITIEVLEQGQNLNVTKLSDEKTVPRNQNESGDPIVQLCQFVSIILKLGVFFATSVNLI